MFPRTRGAVPRGCLAAATLPFIALAAPLVAWRRRSARVRRGDRLVFSLDRQGFGEIVRLRCEIDVPAGRLPELAAALGGAVAEGAHWVGAPVGCVGIVAGEEPILVSVAPVRDVVAARVSEALVRGEAHRRPEMWLTLPAGRYLGQVIDPYRPFAGSDADLAELVRLGKVGHALRAETVGRGVSARLLLTLYGPRRELRKLLTLARRVLVELPGWTRSR